MIHLSSSETGSDNAEKRSSRQKINELNIFNDSKIIFYLFFHPNSFLLFWIFSKMRLEFTFPYCIPDDMAHIQINWIWTWFQKNQYLNSESTFIWGKVEFAGGWARQAWRGVVSWKLSMRARCAIVSSSLYQQVWLEKIENLNCFLFVLNYVILSMLFHSEL